MPPKRLHLIAACCTAAIGFLYGSVPLSAPGPLRKISWQVPEDGGTPRDPSRIVKLGPREFRILAKAEEGRRPLTHAVSRVNLVCRDSGPAAEEVTVHIDLSGDGQRTNYDHNIWGGMPKRDFIYIQAPGQPWRRPRGKPMSVSALGIHTRTIFGSSGGCRLTRTCVRGCLAAATAGANTGS